MDLRPDRRKQARTLFVGVLTLPCLGFTQCAEFSDVTVPAVDDTAPVVGFQLLASGDIELGSAYYETDKHDTPFHVVPFGMDTGGVRSLRITQTGKIRCPGAVAFRVIEFFDMLDESTATVGDEVSNGRWEFLSFTPSIHAGPQCTVEWYWNTTATDFNGNATTERGGVVYSPA